MHESLAFFFIPSPEEQLRSHMLGQRHWFNVRQREQARRSVFVRGFGSSVSEEEVGKLLGRFGAVRAVFFGDKVGSAWQSFLLF